MKKNLKSNNVNVENNVVYDRSKQDEEISVKGYEHIESQMFTTDYAIIHSKFWKQNNDIFKFIKDNSHLIQNFSKNDYSVGLFLLLLYKNGLINIESENDNNSGNIKDRLTHFFTLVNNTNEHFDETLKQYKPVLNFFEPIVDRLSTEFIEGLLKFFKQINADIMDAYFIEFFEDTIKSFSDKMEVEYFNVPFDLVRFVYSLAEIKPGAKIYEPNSGNASFGIFLNDSVEYIGMVNAEITWVLGVLHRITYNSKNKINYEFSSSNNNWQEDKFDLIILHNNEYFDCNAKIINNALNSLIENGKIVLITNDNDNRHLKELVNNDFIEMVIELPRELGTDNLIVISKNKVQEKSKRIFFVEFKDYWMNPYFIFYSEKILNTIEIETVGDNIFNSNFIDYFKQIKEFRENSNRTMVDRANGKREKVKLFYKINQKIVNLLEVIDNGYSLKVERYFLEKIEGAVRLGDILEPVGKIINFNADNESIDIEFEDYFSNDDLPKSGHLIEVDTLKENADSLKIIPSELQNTIRYLDKDCILIPRFKFDNLEFYDFS
ncbi:MAG: hypothetical protein QM539_03575, partial [Alphaproteobacteria bacterium]|nr:hypothetical protein [Alphaproteobacteria bacterium]